MSEAAGRATLLRTIALEADGLRALHAALGGDLGALVLDAVAAIRAAPGRVIVTGMGKSGHVGRKIAATMASTGTPAHFVHPAEASHGDLGMIGREDVVLALSWSGEAPELADIIAYTRRFEVKLVAITSRAGSALGGGGGYLPRFAADAGSLPERARAHHQHDDAAGHRRCSGDGAAGSARCRNLVATQPARRSDAKPLALA